MRYAAPIPEIPAPMISTSEYSASSAPTTTSFGPAEYHDKGSAVERVDDRRERLHRDRSRLVDADSVGDARHPVADVRGDLAGAAAGRDGVQHVVVDEPPHVLPAAMLEQPVELGLQVAPAVHVQQRTVRRRRRVEREQPAGGGMVVPRRHDDFRDDGEVAYVASSGGQALPDSGH